MSQQLFHLSSTNLDGAILHPQIPNNYFVRLGYEDNTIPRISFAPSIDHCILGIGFNRIKDGARLYYVHEPADYSAITIMDNKDIVSKNLSPDAQIVKESWVTSDCKLKCIGKIEIVKPTDKYETVFYNGKEITKQYYWEYRTI